MKNDKYAALFESRRPFLIGLAYRILGSLADAEDAVQDTYIKWLNADRHSILNPAAWLTTVCTRRCLDLLRAAQQARVDYVGIWLPEPIQTAVAKTPEQTLELSSSLSTAFMLLLERLTPRERAAYLLHDIFDLPYADLAMTLGGEETACRKLVSRAREKLAAQRSVKPSPQSGRKPCLSLSKRRWKRQISNRFRPCCPKTLSSVRTAAAKCPPTWLNSSANVTCSNLSAVNCPYFGEPISGNTRSSMACQAPCYPNKAVLRRLSVSA